MDFSTAADRAAEIKQRVSDRLSNLELTVSIMITIVVAVTTVLIVLFFGIWKLRTKVLPSQSLAPRKPRFRKRDKVLFYGRKMLRKVRSFTKKTMTDYSGQRSKGLHRRQIVMKMAKRLLRMKKDPSMPQLHVKEPPQSFLEADSSELEDIDHRLPSEVLYLLRSVRVFGHFEKPLFLELCRHLESVFVPAGGYLFRIGDVDKSIYVVQSGKIDVTITESDGTEYLVKEVLTGDSIYSLLSILGVLTGHFSPYKTVSAKAVQDSTILKLPATAFQSVFETFPESMVRVVQVIMVRLQRVTFTALHNYLGLSSELIDPHSHTELKTLSIYSLTTQASPLKQHGAAGQDAERLPKVRVEDADYSGTPRRTSEGSVPIGRQASEESPGSRLKPRKMSDNASVTSTQSDKDVLDLAKKDLIMLFKLKDEKQLNGRVHLRHLKAGTNLIKQGDQDNSLVFVVTGTLLMLQQMVGEEEREAHLFSAYSGDIVGTLAVLTGEPSFFTIRAKTDVRVATVSKSDFYLIMREQPSVVLNVAQTTLKRLTGFVRQIDFALDWMILEAGRALFRQGDHSECVYIVLTGRMRSVITLTGGKKELVGEYGRGEIVGLVEVLTQTERATTVMAVRDTELAKIPAELLNLIKRKHPQVVTRLIHLLGQRILGNLQTRDTVHLSDISPGVESKASVTNLATVAVLPVSSDVPLTNFTLELNHALNAIGSTLRLTCDTTKARLGAAALDSVNEFRLFNWLGQQEDNHRMVLYQCDKTLTKWTKICIRQADCILIVGLADKEPTVGQIEKQLDNIAVRAQKELILLHKEEADWPKRTVEWLNARGWCSSHHHIKAPKRVFKKLTLAKTKEMYEHVFQKEPDRHSDCSRLARFLTGTSVGLVLGGGGARGLSHVGIIKALVDSGIPIDMVGGTSMGAFIGALYCEDRNLSLLTQRARKWSFSMMSLWSKIIDLTYPATSMFTGSAFNHTIEETFKDKQIEDLWIPYFCVTTDISNSSMRIHTHGSLWRYVRSSMSLSGYLPPLCDPVDGHLLLDGGYVNNLPADVIRTLGAKTIFAVDVGAQDETDLTNYGDELSGWWLLWKRWNPWAKPVKVPDMNEIQGRLAYVSCVRQLETVKNSDYCEYIRPPIDKYGTLQFGHFDEISEVGYNHGKTLLSGWIKGGLVDELFKEKSVTDHKKAGKKITQQAQPHVPVMAYFTDLAELVSKIEEPQRPVFYAPVGTEDTDDSSEGEEIIVESEDPEYEDDDDDYDDIEEKDDEEADETKEEETPESKVQASPAEKSLSGSRLRKIQKQL